MRVWYRLFMEFEAAVCECCVEPGFCLWRSGERRRVRRDWGSCGPGFLALHTFIYSLILLFVFGSLLFGRMAGVPGQVDHVSKYASFGHDFRLFVLTL